MAGRKRRRAKLTQLELEQLRQAYRALPLGSAQRRQGKRAYLRGLAMLEAKHVDR